MSDITVFCNTFFWRMVKWRQTKMATSQNGNTKMATKWPGQNGNNPKLRQKFIANDETIIGCLVTKSALNK